MSAKGAHLADDAKDMKTIGELWAGASEGHCLFAMPTGGAFGDIEKAICRAGVA